MKRLRVLPFSLASALLVSSAPMIPAALWAGSDDGFTVAVRRLTESEYRHTIADLFGPEIKIEARFEPEQREEGLLALGSAMLSLTPSGFEQYFALASSIAEQVLGEDQRQSVMRCAPADPSAPDEACTRDFVSHYGELIFRRPLTEPEILARLRSAEAATRQSNDFYTGLKVALSSLLVAPEYLFRVETAEPDPENPEQYRLDAYTKASRLSFLFWNTSPDRELLDAAKSGALHTAEGLEQQLSRLVSSPRFEDGVRAFFSDLLQIDGLATMVKDPAIYPKFNQSIADSAEEQMLRTVVDLLVDKKRDYRDLFTSNETSLNRPLAAVYKVPFTSKEEWAAYDFPESSGRSGILTQIGFLSLFSHPGASSPTRRGIKVLEIFMCKPTPDPPADVDFSQVQDNTAGTVRTRLLAHMENQGCAFCHKRTDPPGLALEHFDGLGQTRRYENGALIDVTADFSGAHFEGAQGLGQYLRDEPRVPSCLVRNLYAYGTGRKVEPRDEVFLSDQAAKFASDGYRLPDLMQQLASTPEFFEVVVPEETETAASPTSADTAAVASTAQLQP